MGPMKQSTCMDASKFVERVGERWYQNFWRGNKEKKANAKQKDIIIVINILIYKC